MIFFNLVLAARSAILLIVSMYFAFFEDIPYTIGC